MNLYCIKRLMFTKNWNIKIKREIDMEKLIFILVVLLAVLKSLKLLVRKNWVIYYKVYSKYKTMLSYCLKCRKNAERKNPRVVKTKTGRIMISSNSAVYGSK